MGFQEGVILSTLKPNPMLYHEFFFFLIFGKGMRTATFQFSESGGSVNGPNLFTELPFL